MQLNSIYFLPCLKDDCTNVPLMIEGKQGELEEEPQFWRTRSTKRRFVLMDTSSKGRETTG